jgi:hypothetical protein
MTKPRNAAFKPAVWRLAPVLPIVTARCGRANATVVARKDPRPAVNATGAAKSLPSTTGDSRGRLRSIRPFVDPADRPAGATQHTGGLTAQF